MKKICILATAAVLAFSGAVIAGCSGDETIETAGESTRLTTSKSPDELDAYNVAYAFIDKQDKLTSYELLTTGETVATKGIITYTQEIENLEIKHGDEYFQQAISSSSLVNMSHQAFVKGDSVAYRNATSGDISTATKAEYKSVYGISPDDAAIGGYIFNADTIVYAELVSENADGSYTYRYVLDGDTAGANAKLQMKEYGGLSGYPVFSDLTLTLTINSDWTPICITTAAEYTISKSVLGEMSCTQNLNCVYSNVNGDVAIPDTEAFNAAIGSTPTQVTGAQADSSLYMQIAETFASYDWTTGRQFDLSVAVKTTAEGGEVSCNIPATMYAAYNKYQTSVLDAVYFGLTADLSGFAYTPTLVTALNSELYGVCENISEASLYYIGDGNLYVTLSGGDTVYLVDSADLTPVLRVLLGYVDLSSADEFDVDYIFTILGYIFDENGNTLSLNSELTQALGYDFSLDIVADLTENASSLTLNGGLTIAEMKLELSAALKDGGALASSKAEDDMYALYETLADEEAASEVRDAISALNSAKVYGESYYASAVKSAQRKYAALTDAQKALVINYNLLPDENGAVSGALLTALSGLTEIDYSTGVCLGVDVNIGLVANLGCDGYVYGDLYFKYNEDAVAEGDILNAVNFRLDVDLNNYFELLYMVQSFAEDALPFDSALLNLTNAAVYYTGDGNLYITLENNGAVTYFTAIDLTALSTDDGAYEEVSFAEIIAYIADADDPVLKLKALEAEMFTEVDGVDGTKIILNQSYVEALNALYAGVVETIEQSASSMGTFVVSIISQVLNCNMTEVVITVDNAGVFRGITFDINGNIALYEDEVVNIFSAGVYVDGVLTDEMDGDAEYLDEVSANAEAAYAVYDKIQNIIDNIWIGDDYLAAVADAKDAYDALTDEQKNFVTNAYITVDYVSISVFEYCETLHETLKTAADGLLEGFGEDGEFGTDFTEEDWLTYNDCYAVIKDYDGALDYVTQAKIQMYITARYNYEKAIVEELMRAIAQTLSDYSAGEITLQDALESYYGEYVGVYEILGDESKQDIDDDYNAFAEWVLGENYKGVTAAINNVISEMNALIEKGVENVSYEDIVSVYKDYASAYAWYTGSDNYNAYLNNKTSLMFSYVNWMNNLCPAALTEEYSVAAAAYNDLYQLTYGYSGAFVVNFSSVIVMNEYADRNYPLSNAAAQDADLSGLTLEQAEKLYEEVTVMYYITYRGGTSVQTQYMVTAEDGTTAQARLILNSYRTTVAAYIASLQA